MFDATKLTMEDVLPHRGRMILLDRIVSCDMSTESVVTEFTVTPSHIFFDHGSVPNWVAVEFMAQACAALSGAADKIKAPEVAARPGLLLGTRRLDLKLASFENGKTYRVTAKRIFGDDDTAAFECSILLDGAVVADAVLNAYRPPSMIDFLKEQAKS